MRSRRQFVHGLALGATSMVIPTSMVRRLSAEEADVDAGLLQYIERSQGQFDRTLYCKLLGAANEFKEGDEIIGIAASDDGERRFARRLLANTELGDIDRNPPYADDLYQLTRGDSKTLASSSFQSRKALSSWTFAELKAFLLEQGEAEIKQVMPALSSDMIGCVVKLMTNSELIVIGAKVFNALPGSQIGAKGYLGARVQPNSPTDHPDDIRWQVFNAFSFAVGDVLIGTNPVSSEVESVKRIQKTLQEILVRFGISNLLPHCVLSHIDVQAEVESQSPGSTELWFQSIAGTDGANETFDLTNSKMQRYARMRNGRFGLYFETGQGADFTNGHGNGFDMVLHESRKYGFARSLKQSVAAKRGESAWVHLNDVAGFIGPEVFRSRDQLVRCCLEDIVMGKLHGLCIGLDVCSTLHMSVSLDDLDWCLEQIAPANPAYLMALPTKIDPMLGYLTTGYQDHVRLREKFGFRINDAMWKFYQSLGVIDSQGAPTEHFGDPLWVYTQFQRKGGDTRPVATLRAEGQKQIEQVRSRGLFIAQGHGHQVYELEPQLADEIKGVYQDGKESIWAELSEEFVKSVPDRWDVVSKSTNREDYILHPESGEHLSDASVESLAKLRQQQDGNFDTQIVVSDGLNAHSIMDEGHLLPFLTVLREQLTTRGFRASPHNVLVRSGRVRTGYRIGEQLFGESTGNCNLVHLIGERPGTGHHTFSVYLTSAPAADWGVPDTIDHNITKVVSGIASTAFEPRKAAIETARILGRM